jgi:hypothetical protein
MTIRLSAATGLLLLGVSVCISAAGQTQRAFPADWNTFSADFTIQTQQILSNATHPAAPATPVTYHMERTQVPSGWKTVTTFLSSRPFVYQDHGKQVQIDHDPIARIEDDGDGTPPRIIARDGQPLELISPQFREAILAKVSDQVMPRLPAQTEEDRRRRTERAGRTGRDWLRAIVDTRPNADRQAQLARRYGRARDQQRGFDHFISFSGNRRAEVLAERQTGLVSAIDVYENNELKTHATYAWTEGPGRSFVRFATHTERRLNANARLAVDVQIANVTLERRTR